MFMFQISFEEVQIAIVAWPYGNTLSNVMGLAIEIFLKNLEVLSLAFLNAFSTMLEEDITLKLINK